jgi:hypothetical protein
LDGSIKFLHGKDVLAPRICNPLQLPGIWVSLINQPYHANFYGEQKNPRLLQSRGLQNLQTDQKYVMGAGGV